MTVSLGMPVTTEQGPAKSESRADLRKGLQVETIDGILSTLASFDDIPGIDIARAPTETTRERLREVKEKADRRTPLPVNRSPSIGRPNLALKVARRPLCQNTTRPIPVARRDVTLPPLTSSFE